FEPGAFNPFVVPFSGDEREHVDHQPIDDSGPTCRTACCEVEPAVAILYCPADCGGLASPSSRHGEGGVDIVQKLVSERPTAGGYVRVACIAEPPCFFRRAGDPLPRFF